MFFLASFIISEGHFKKIAVYLVSWLHIQIVHTLSWKKSGIHLWLTIWKRRISWVLGIHVGQQINLNDLVVKMAGVFEKFNVTDSDNGSIVEKWSLLVNCQCMKDSIFFWFTEGALTLHIPTPIALSPPINASVHLYNNHSLSLSKSY